MLNEIREYFMPLREKYIDSGLLDPEHAGDRCQGVDLSGAGRHAVQSAFSARSRLARRIKLEDVLNEVPRVRKDAGYPPLVTPTSQIVGTQAVFNVITGERYKMCTKECKDRVAGKYGTTPVTIDTGVTARRSLATRSRSPAARLTCWSQSWRSFVQRLPSGLSRRKTCSPMRQFPKVALDFFKKRRDAEYGIDGALSNAEKQVHPV